MFLKNPFKKKVKVTLAIQIQEDVDRTKEIYHNAVAFKPRLERLGRLYPGIIRHVDIVINKRITLREDTQIPDEFLCSCKLLGLRVKKIDERISYSRNHRYYMAIDFYNEVTDVECDD